MIQYNDYELLYLMNEFDEEAEKILIEKYSVLIRFRIRKFRVKDRYIDDFMQEGLYMLLIAAKTYNEMSEKTFTKYFDLILQRKFQRLIEQEKNYFYNVDLIEDINSLREPNVFIYEHDKQESFSTFEEKVLKYQKKNYRPREIAQFLNCDIKSVYNCLYRIKEKYNRN